MLIAFDADDTLWHSERYYYETQQAYTRLLAHYNPDPVQVLDVLHEIEIANLPVFGYGIKGFAISMVEAAVQISGGRVTGGEVQRIIDLARAMLTHEVALLEGAVDALEALSPHHRLILITKGDLMDQQRKISASGLVKYFQGVEIVSDKTPDVYRDLLQKYNTAPEAFLMVGNSLRSDILPVLALGGWGVHVPYHITWAHESGEVEQDTPRFFTIDHLGLLPEVVEKLV